MFVVILCEIILAVCFMVMMDKTSYDVYGLKEELNNAINDTYNICCNQTESVINKKCSFLNNLHADCASEEKFKSSCIDTINDAVNPIYGIFIAIIVIEFLAILVGCCITCLGRTVKQNKYHSVGDNGTDEEVVGLRVNTVH